MGSIVRQRMRWFIQDISKDYKPYSSMFTKQELFDLMEEYELCYDPLTKKLYTKRLVKAGYLKPFHRQGKFQLVNPEIERIAQKSRIEELIQKQLEEGDSE